MIINVQTMAAKFKQLSPFVGVKSTLPAVERILFEVKEGSEELELTATNLNMTMTTTMTVKEPEPFKTCIDYVDLNKLLSVLQHTDYTIKVLKTKVKFISPFDDVFEFPAYNADEFPLNPVLKEVAAYDMSASFFKSVLTTFQPFILRDELRPAMESIFFEVDGVNLKVTATNAHILINKVYNGFFEKEHAADDFMIPGKGSIAKSITGEKIQFVNGDNKVKIIGDGYTIYLTKIDGRYPNYSAVIPDFDSQNNFIEIKKDQFLNAIKTVDAMAGSAGTFILNVSESNLKVIASDADRNKNGIVNVSATCKFLENEDVVSYRTTFMMNILDSITDDTINLSYAPKRAGYLKHVDDNLTVNLIIMPVMIPEGDESE